MGSSLWLAIAMYSVGLAAVLSLRPALMFNENGTWKEFGYHRSPRHTLFPVWLFVIVWAIVSYVVATALTWSSIAAAAASAARWTPAKGLVDNAEAEREEEGEEDDEEAEEETEDFTIPVSRVPRRIRGAKKPRPGYYVVDPESEERGGLRRYIYYGERPPE